MSRRLYDHLGNTRSAERLAADESLALDAGKEVAERGKGEEEGDSKQARNAEDERQVLHDSHDTVGAGAHVVGRDSADGRIEGR